jgi:two-component system sensor histidine kinase/response regulator
MSHRAAVLAVDDRPANLLALSAVLEPLDVELVTGSSGRDAIRLASERPFAVMLIDVVMPDMDGFDTVRAVRALPLAAQTPIILLTAYEFDPRQIESLQGAALVDYVGKPIAPGLLRGKVEALVSLYRRGEALAAKDRGIAILAHDLQTPLASIATGTELMVRCAPDQRTQAVGLLVAQTVQRMSGMVSDLTDYARVGQGAIPVKARPLDLADLAREVATACQHLDGGERIRVDGAGDARGEWDADRLYQAISNLVVNALRYGEGDIQVRTTGSDGVAQISVQSFGPPIPASRLSTIFEPFQRGAEHARADRQGLGLGLYIVRAIVAAHGGSVHASSSQQGGTVFTLQLPRRPSPPAT